MGSKRFTGILTTRHWKEDALMKVISLSGVFLPGGHETFPTDPGVEKIFSITSGWSMKLMMHILRGTCDK
jgi:hypothetical protein